MPSARVPRRIVVALDTGSLSRAAIEAAARLAIGLGADLEALFVEDTSLRRLAELPFARELGNTSGQARRFDVAELDRAIGVQAQQVRRAIEAAARGLPLNWSFEVVRGNLIAVVLERTAAADLLVLGITRRPAYRGVHGEAVMRRLERRVAHHPIIGIFDGSPAAPHVLEAALALALERRAHVSVHVAIPAARPEQFGALRGQADAIFAERGRASGGYVCLPDAGIATIAAMAKRQRAGAILVPVADLARAEHEFEGLVDEIACPVVLVR
jgi:hypothetical protein